MRARFKMIRYGDHNYGDIKTTLKEIPGHFGVRSIEPGEEDYSLHTDHSPNWDDHKLQILTNPVLDRHRLPVLRDCKPDGTPRLWTGRPWVDQFLKFITVLVDGYRHPRVIEIHPPFKKDCPDMPSFLALYQVFEEQIGRAFPGAQVLLEHRNGGFLVEDPSDIVRLVKVMDHSFRLRFVLDVPQVITRLRKRKLGSVSPAAVMAKLEELSQFKKMIRSVHISGKGHGGDLDSLFGSSADLDTFLKKLSDWFDDGQVRYMVPEANGVRQTDFSAMCKKLRNYFEFQDS